MQSPIESSARALLANFAAGRMAAATSDFNDDLRPIVTPAVLAGVKTTLDQQAGRFLSVTEVHQRRRDGFRAMELIARFEKMPVSVVVVFDALDKVGAVYFSPVTAPSVDETLEKAARDLQANFVAGRYEEMTKSFDANMHAQLTPAGLAGLAESIAKIYGTFGSVIGVSQSRDKTFRFVDLTLSYTKMPATFRVAFDAEGRVAALRITPYAH
jgi:hypothetical protein